MKSKVKTKDYKVILECILSEQVCSTNIVFYFNNKKFYKYYKERTR